VQRVAVVTGGAGGIGSAICSALEAAGHRVISLDRDSADPIDLSVEADVTSAAARVLGEHGRCDVFVHAAAAFNRADLAHLDLVTWRRVQAVNVEAALLLCQAFAPSMATNGFGRIIFIVSDTVWSPPSREMLAYVTSKAALIGLARALAVSLGPDSIAVTTVAPGLTATPIAQRDLPAAVFDDVLSRQPLTRTLVPDDVAQTVVFLASDAAAALTGQTICVDGGLVLR
jgi:NAD(P)-dependent dehydrogenase (short-subunit alcohol dehydrogenase family)